MALTRETLLRRATELMVHIAGSEVAVHGPAGTARGGPMLLSALELFVNPLRLSEGLDRLAASAHAAVDFVDASTAVMRLVGVGALNAVDGDAPAPKSRGTGFDAARIHIRMLDDEQRTRAYLQAIERTVKPGDVVVDLGTGTGVLAIAAARAGARHVYAIEATDITACAEELFAANGVADRVTLVRGVSSAVELPERADVLVTEIFGHDPFAERALEYILDARRRFLRPDAQVIPRRLKVFAELVTIDEQTLAARVFTESAARRWQERYGIDFSPLARMPQPESHSFVVDAERTLAWPRLAPPALLADIALATVPSPVLEETAACTVQRDGTVNGVLVWFVLELGDGLEVSTRPGERSPTSWRCMVWTFGNVLTDTPRGTEVVVRLVETTCTAALSIE